jgi:hypothetical protein
MTADAIAPSPKPALRGVTLASKSRLTATMTPNIQGDQ